jgi:NADH-quinone oxidoreductase subunit N
VLKRVYVASPDAAAIHSPLLSQVIVLVLAAAVVLLGCAPQLLLRWIESAIQISGL